MGFASFLLTRFAQHPSLLPKKRKKKGIKNPASKRVRMH